MPEPDFKQIAIQILDDADTGAPGEGISLCLAEYAIAEQLRLVWNAGYEIGYHDGESSRGADMQVVREDATDVWNARGAADVATAKELFICMGPLSPADELDRALRALDR